MTNWILNIIGILIYFINRYAGRTKKTVKFSFKFWLVDNWPELATTLLLNLALMLLLNSSGTEIDYDQLLAWMPAGIKFAAEPLASFLIGLGLSHFLYSVFRKKVKDAKG